MDGKDERLEAIRPTLQELGREWAARRKKVGKVCPQCGKEFVGWKKQTYCSGACRVAAHRAKTEAA